MFFYDRPTGTRRASSEVPPARAVGPGLAPGCRRDARRVARERSDDPGPAGNTDRPAADALPGRPALPRTTHTRGLRLLPPPRPGYGGLAPASGDRRYHGSLGGRRAGGAGRVR